MNHAPKPHTWVWTVLLGLILFGVYLANGREIGSDDTEPTRLLTYALMRGDGPYLDRFRAGFELRACASAVRDPVARALGLALPDRPGMLPRRSPGPRWPYATTSSRAGTGRCGRRTTRRAPRRSSPPP